MMMRMRMRMLMMTMVALVVSSISAGTKFRLCLTTPIEKSSYFYLGFLHCRYATPMKDVAIDTALLDSLRGLDAPGVKSLEPPKADASLPPSGKRKSITEGVSQKPSFVNVAANVQSQQRQTTLTSFLTALPAGTMKTSSPKKRKRKRD